MAKTIKSLEEEISLLKEDLADMLTEKSKTEADIKKLESEKKEILGELGKVKSALRLVEDYVRKTLKDEEEPDRKVVETIQFLLGLITDSEVDLIVIFSKDSGGESSLKEVTDLIKGSKFDQTI